MSGLCTSTRAALRALALAVALLSLSSGAAAAGTLRGTSDGLTYQDSRGEANAVTITLEGPDIRVHDAATPVEADDFRCRQVDAQTAVCSFGDNARFGVLAGAGDDSVEVVGPARTGSPRAFLSGDDGNDTLIAGP